VTYTVTANIDPAATGTLNNTATVTSEINTSPSDNSDNDLDNLEPVADLEISKSDNPDPVIAGTQLTYTIKINNNGPSDAQNVVVTDIIPSGVVYDANKSDARCIESGVFVICNLGNMTGVSSDTVVIVVKVNFNVTGNFKNTVNVTSNTSDNDTSDNSYTETTSIMVIKPKPPPSPAPPPRISPYEPSMCGNYICEPPAENSIYCCIDCGPECGDNVCNCNETCEICPGDCGKCPKLIINCTEDAACKDTITCNVTDETNKSIPNATVTLTLQNNTFKTFITDENGSIQFIEEHPTKIDAIASKRGYEDSNTTNISVTMDCACGDKRCYLECDETCENCPEDCGPCEILPNCTCGDKKCYLECNETCENCPEDCGHCLLKLIINCTEDVAVGDTVTCRVTDMNNNPVPGANVTFTMPGKTAKTFTTDSGGNVYFTAPGPARIDAIASKKGYKDSETVQIYVSGKNWLWYILLLILLLLLLLIMLRKKKVVADLKFLEKAESEGKLEEVLNKFKKIYVTSSAYSKIIKKIKKIKNEDRIEKVELNEKGRNYLKEVGDETAALAMQISAKIVLSHDYKIRNIAEGKGFKVLELEDTVKNK